MALFLLGSVPAFAGSDTYEFEQINLSPGTARGITASKYAQPTGSEPPCAGFATVAGASIRFRVDGGVATSTTGHKVSDGGNFTMDSWSDIRNLSMIPEVSASTVSISLSRGCGTLIKR